MKESDKKEDVSLLEDIDKKKYKDRESNYKFTMVSFDLQISSVK